MPSAETLAQVSNAAIYASMLTLSLAMLAFAASFAAGRGRVADSVLTVTGAAVRASTSARSASAGGVSVVTAAPRLPAVEDDGANIEPGRRSGNIAMSLSWLGFGLLLVGVVLRGVWAGRVPWGNMYEFSISTAVALLGAFLAYSLRRDIRWFGIFVVVPVLLILGLAVTVLYTEAAQLVPALKSYWLVIHVSAAVICSGAFALGAALSALYLVRARAERLAGADAVPQGAFASRLPAADRLDGLAYRINAFVFPLWTFAVIAGAIWAENAWGRYWGWDPKETWAFITWVIYAGYLHARATAGWKGTRSAIICLIGFGSLTFNYFAVNLIFNGKHSYSGV